MQDICTRVRAQVRLPCGCWVEHGLACSAGPADFCKTMKLVCDILPHWLDRIELAHRCELVSDENPDGEAKSN